MEHYRKGDTVGTKKQEEPGNMRCGMLWGDHLRQGNRCSDVKPKQLCVSGRAEGYRGQRMTRNAKGREC